MDQFCANVFYGQFPITKNSLFKLKPFNHVNFKETETLVEIDYLKISWFLSNFVEKKLISSKKNQIFIILA